MKKFAILWALGLFCAIAMPVSSGFAQQTVIARAGIHERSNRLVFDWTERVEYNVSENGNNVAIQFNKPSNAQLNRALAMNMPYIRGLAQEQTAKGLLIRFQIPDNARIAPFRLGTKVAFDVIINEKRPPIFSQKEPEVTPPAAPAPKAEATKQEEAKQEKTNPIDQQTVAQTPVEQPVPPVENTVDNSADNRQQESAAKILPPPPTLAQPEQQLSQQQIASENAQSPRLLTLADRLAEMANRQASGKAIPADRSATRPDELSGTVIRLDPGEYTKLAAFIRAGKLWLVLDKPLKDFMPEIEGDLLALFSRDARRIDHPKATAFVLDAPKPKENGEAPRYSIRRDKTEWQIWIDNKDKTYLPEDMPVNVVQSAEGQQSHLALYAGEQPTIIRMRDRNTGERLWIVPVRVPEGRIAQTRMAPGYQFAPTFMGAVIILTDDMMTLAPSKDMVLVYPTEGMPLLLSSNADREKGLEQARFLPLFRLTMPHLKGKDFTRQRQEIQLQMVRETDVAKQVQYLLDMARLYVANGYGHEALGLLRMASAASKTIENENEFRALRGMAAALAGDVRQAEQDLKTDALQAQPAAKLWLGYALARNDQWQPAHNAFLESGLSEQSFPKKLQPRLVLAKAEANLFAGDPVRVNRELKKITTPDDLTTTERAAYDYLNASLDVMMDRGDRAVTVFQALSRGNDRLYGVKSTLAFVQRGVQTGTMTLPDAIETLERLRYSWRGDRLEIDVLRQLGQYYVDNKQYADGLTIWRQAASLAQNSDDIDAITSQMQKVFRDLYVDNGAKDIQPLQAVALFERFRELTPSGEAGSTALSNLAERLAAVDLLDQADALLSKQLDQTSDPEKLAAMGARLARWRLLNNDARGALDVLNKTSRDAKISGDITHRRLLLRARALADVGQVDQALMILNTERSDDALGLKVDINWRQNRWSEALDALQNLVVSYRNQEQNDVNGVLPDLILKMAIALTLDGNPKGMELLNAQYGDYMRTTPKARIFNIISKPMRGSDLADLDTLKKQVGEAELFQKFLQASE